MSCNLKSMLYAGAAILTLSSDASALDMERILRYIDNHPDVDVTRNSTSALEQATFSLSRNYNEFIKPVRFKHTATKLGSQLVTRFTDFMSGNEIEVEEYGGNPRDQERLDNSPEGMRMYNTIAEQTKNGIIRKRTGESSKSSSWDKQTRKRILNQYLAALERTDTEAKTYEENVRKELKHKKHKHKKHCR